MCDNFYGNCHYKFARIIYVGCVQKKKKNKEGEKTIGEGAMGEKKIGKKGERFYPTRQSKSSENHLCKSEHGW